MHDVSPSRHSPGAAADWLTQQWVKATGRRMRREELAFFEGPAGDPSGIGGEFFERWAARSGLAVMREGTARGLLPDFDQLRGPTFDPAAVHPEVRAFYERTSEYELDAWSEWCGAFRPFGRLLAIVFSRRLQQLNVPLGPLDTSYGATSDVVHLVDPASGQTVMAAWIRRLRRTGHVLYAGSYAVGHPPGHPGPCVKVVFPLPNGNGIVLLRPEVDAGGALTVMSAGRAFGDPGFYFTVHGPGNRVWARYVRTMQESIRVYPVPTAEGGGVRADHTMWIWGRVFLRLHYRLRLQQAAGRRQEAGKE
jgi:hypothetical protein